MVCTFFGHRFMDVEIRTKLICVLTHLIEQNDEITFYVGNNGDFDRAVTGVLAELKKDYPHIVCRVVLAYPPGNSDDTYCGLETVYPEGLETVPRKYAIVRRNQWMISRCDMVVAYARFIGGARTFRDEAKKKGKVIIDLATP